MNQTDVHAVPLAAPLTSGAVRLDDWGVIVAQGPDAASFLHTQLTQNIQTLPDNRARLAGYCSPKGRLLASFVVCRLGPDSLALLCSADLLAATLKRLSMFVMRAKCKLTDGSALWAVWGLAGVSAGDWLGADAAGAPTWVCGARAAGATAGADARALWVSLPDVTQTAAMHTPRWLHLVPLALPAPPLPPLPSSTWAWLEVCSGIPRVTAATADHFVPQMINFELLGGVDFQKGCYPGQEVVARSQYRGTLKRRMVLMHGATVLAPGQDVQHSSDPDQPAGEVVLAAPAPQGGFDALVEVKLAMLEAEAAPGHFFVGGAVASSTAGSNGRSALTPGALPYALTAPA